ncbi:hypothetical protein GCM10007913_32670 [Devosia yakushimensis]|uniref:Uncharacterized protein n=1 Tax=Devosia yakushimensis TaxID=470028 RepID=A0ABQ5UJJ9_9HYPH|nr:hypothetical protein GCM10007913_32670 [Devosia yakushimensis]
MQGMENLASVFVNKVLRPGLPGSPDMIQAAGYEEAVEVSVEAHAMLGIDRVRWPGQAIGTVPANIDAAPCRAGNVEAAVESDFTANSGGVADDKQTLPPSRTVLQLKQANVRQPTPIYRSFPEGGARQALRIWQ